MANKLIDLTIREVSAVDRPANAENGIPRARIALLKRDSSMDLKQRVLKYLYPPLGNPADKPKARSFKDVYAQVEQMEEFDEMGTEFQEKINALCQCAWLILNDAGVKDKQKAINDAVDEFVASVKSGLTEADEEAEKLFKGDWDDSDEICKAVWGIGKTADGKLEQDGKRYPKSDYAFTPDDTPTNWKLRLTSTPGGAPDAKIVGSAVAALGKGFRGKKVQISADALPGVKSKVRAAWRKANPDRGADEMPSVLKGETMTLQEIETKLGEQGALITKQATEIETVKAANESLKAENQTLKSASDLILKMNKKERKAYASMTEEKRKEYMAADETKRKSMMDEASKALKGKDDELDDDEKEAKKRAELEATVETLKSESATTKAELAKAKDLVAKSDARVAEIEKQARVQKFQHVAETELPNTAGSPVEKGEMLMTLADTLPGGETGDAFKRYLGNLKTADNAMKKHFQEVGKSVGGEDLEVTKRMDVAVQEIVKRDKCSVAKAWQTAMTEQPDLYEQYNREHVQAA